MKKILFAPLLILCLICCSKAKTPIETYLKEHNPNLESLEMIEVSETDSAYSPYRELISLSYVYTDLDADIASLNSKAFKAKSNKEAISILDSALNIYTQEYSRLDSITFKCFRAIDFSDLATEKNRICAKAKYKIDGEVKEQRFYFNADGETIGHTDEDIRNLANEILSELKSLRKTKEEVEKDKRDIKRGEYRIGNK